MTTTGVPPAWSPAHVYRNRDTLFQTPYVDDDEWRDEPVRHRYVHGGFEGTDTRFAMYFPPADRYEGRFFQPLMPVSGTEFGAATGVLTGMAGLGGWIDFSIGSGGALVESNLGRTDPFPGTEPGLTEYRASAAVARYFRVLASEMYGEHRSYGYVSGGSGGAFKTKSCFEGEVGLWDGAVPFVHGTSMSIPNAFTVQFHAMRVLRDAFPRIVDAIEPGGSGDMYDGLSAEQREALAEVTRMGFPPRSWFDVERIAAGYTGVWSMLVGQVFENDPAYFDEFWTEPGYLGADPPESLARARVQHDTTTTQVITRDEADDLGLVLPLALRVSYPESPVALRLESIPDGDLQGATIEVLSGAATGRRLSVTEVHGDVVTVGFGAGNAEGLAGIAAGDSLTIDNSTYLAAQTYHRHQVNPDFPQWDQFQVGGRPIHPQRPLNLAGVCGQTGRWNGKMIVVQTLMDEAAYPCNAEWYERRVRTHLGDRIDDHYRLWFVDHALHTTPSVAPGDQRPVRTTRVVSYHGVIQQALRDVAAWVEHGLEPPQSTRYRLDDGQVHVPTTAARRRGVQPVVEVTVNGAARADVDVGEVVEFHAVAEVPPGAGTFVAAEWDFEGGGDYPLVEDGTACDGSRDRISLSASYAFDEPGTYFPALRVTSQRQGDRETELGRIQNLGRVRVVVAARTP